jgi:hypothetical protein
MSLGCGTVQARSLIVMAKVVLLELSKGLRKEVTEAIVTKWPVAKMVVARMAGDLMEKIEIKIEIVLKRWKTCEGQERD